MFLKNNQGPILPKENQMPIDNIDLLNEVLLMNTNEDSKKTPQVKNLRNKTISEILNEREMNVDTKEIEESKDQPRLGKTRLRTNTTIEQNQLQNKINEDAQKSSRMRTRSSIIKPNENSNTPDPKFIEENAAIIVKQLTKGLMILKSDFVYFC